jgi:hypothetical protein
MKRSFASLAAALLLGLAISASAEENVFSGVVESVDEATHTMVVKTKEGTHEAVRWTKDTTVKAADATKEGAVDAKDAVIKGLAKGSAVTVHYAREGKDAVARAIERH